ncbi:lytic transglycosylase domain-containing protein [Mucilaginibacter ginkgonis]|uniref:Lytic transglycosylase domain-containing protein n=1 Tax=Mucilaginibacter ginkgonis TaxID=2682091 RepID=A0A6I4INW2_9SPHI|nr:lytic transglycosylase domain-containing protein [Mucilaginibacter ginkgonis]QQL48934.1 lytic transglycosylase domain-containing protein [Mucilaginibacter ginkgonis]
MIKKHLITCSVILVSVVITKLFICSTTEKNSPVNKPHFGNYITAVASENKGYNFADETVPVSNKKVSKRINVSLRKHRSDEETSAMLGRKASKLFPIIEPILVAYGIPEDFKYIPLVESGLKAGVSPKGAAGWWQFMPGTARTYGLKVNSGKDERLNLRRSTIAACKYLRDLKDEVGSWTLAAAAYNCGSPRIRHAINKHNKGNYYLMSLNRETAGYVYKLIAMKKTIEKPGSIVNQRYLATYVNPTELLTVN